jgi:hypothetical protein
MYGMYYDRAGKPIAAEEWGPLFQDPKYKILKQTYLNAEDVFISTVWLGMDHAFGRGPPLIFETMVFKGQGVGEALDCKRYSTEAEALHGHDETIDEWQHDD